MIISIYVVRINNTTLVNVKIPLKQHSDLLLSKRTNNLLVASRYCDVAKLDF